MGSRTRTSKAETLEEQFSTASCQTDIGTLRPRRRRKILGRPLRRHSCRSVCSRLAEERQGVAWHEKTRSPLVVYVDDFKIAAKHGEHDALWASIRRVIDMDPETLDGRFLGCSRERVTTTAQYVDTILCAMPASFKISRICWTSMLAQPATHRTCIQSRSQ